MKRSRKIVFATMATLLVVLGTELAMRGYFQLAGYHIGSFAPGWQQVHKVDHLEVSHSYYTDNTGIFRADADFWRKAGVAIDNNGFRQVQRKDDSIYPPMLLIGDSYVWGAGASSLDKSFADIIAQQGTWGVYNAGIPGADPAQYSLVAEKMLALMDTSSRPVQTVVMLYLGNDLMDEERITAPNQPLFFVTNTGWLPGYYHGVYFPSAEASYKYYLNKYTAQSTLGKMACHTAIGTMLASLPLRLKERDEWKKRRLIGVTNTYLRHIADVCQKHHSQLTIFVIPYLGTDIGTSYTLDPRLYLMGMYQRVFEGLENITFPIPLQKDDYLPLPDGHFNDQGHYKAAAFIMQRLWQNQQIYNGRVTSVAP